MTRLYYLLPLSIAAAVLLYRSKEETVDPWCSTDAGVMGWFR